MMKEIISISYDYNSSTQCLVVLIKYKKENLSAIKR